VKDFGGPQSIAACQGYLRAMMPTPARFPAEETTAFTNLYGPHGVPNGFTPPTTRINLPFTIYYEGAAVNSLNPHTECAASLLAVFNRLLRLI